MAIKHNATTLESEAPSHAITIESSLAMYSKISTLACHIGHPDTCMPQSSKELYFL